MERIALLCVTLLLASCGDRQDVEPRADAVPESEEEAGDSGVDNNDTARFVLPDACALLELQEVRFATGWREPAARDDTDDRSVERSCNYLDGADAGQQVSVMVSASGERYADSEEFARAIGDDDGRLSHPAAPVPDFGFPVIETQVGDIFSMRGSTKQGIELAVSSPTPRITRELFVTALSRL